MKIAHIWKPVKNPAKIIKVLSMGETVQMIDEPNKERLKLWESLNLDDMKPFLPILIFKAYFLIK